MTASNAADLERGDVIETLGEEYTVQSVERRGGARVVVTERDDGVALRLPADVIPSTDSVQVVSQEADR